MECDACAPLGLAAIADRFRLDFAADESAETKAVINHRTPQPRPRSAPFPKKLQGSGYEESPGIISGSSRESVGEFEP
jgi:hypothetical protein